MIDETCNTHQATVPHQTPRLDIAPTPSRPLPQLPAFQAARGFGQLFGLAPLAAVLTMMVDALLFCGEVLSMGMLVVLSVVAALVLGWIVYRIQRFSYGDDHDAALTKAGIVALLTLIPVPITPLFVVPGGVVGMYNLLTRRRQR